MKAPEDPIQAPRWLLPDQNRGYGLLPIPSGRDRAALDWIGSATEEDLARLTSDHWAVLRVFAERMASWAVRSENGEVLERGLLALALAGLGESADSLTVLPLFDHAARRLKMDPAPLFLMVGERVGGEAQKALVSFLGRSDEDRSLAAMGYQEGRDRDGFRYQRNW